LVRASEEDFRREVSAQFTTEWALDGDGLKWKIISASGHIAAAPLALHDEGFAA